MKLAFPAFILAAVVLVAGVQPPNSAGADDPSVSVPPESFFALVAERDCDAARQFYKKYIDVNGLPVVASGEVADLALQRTYSIVTHMLAGPARHPARPWPRTACT